MKIYLATWMLEESQGAALTKIKAWRRLLSYWHTKDKPKGEITNYIKQGTNK